MALAVHQKVRNVVVALDSGKISLFGLALASRLLATASVRRQ